MEWCGVTSQSQVVFCNHEMNLIIKRHRCCIHGSTASTSIHILQLPLRWRLNMRPTLFTNISPMIFFIKLSPFPSLLVFNWYFWRLKCNLIYLKAFVAQNHQHYMIYISTENKNNRRYGLLILEGMVDRRQNQTMIVKVSLRHFNSEIFR